MLAHLRRNLAFAGFVLFAGCGSSHPPTAVRSGDGSGLAAVSQAEVQAYMRYALGFYSWVDPSGPSKALTSCSSSNQITECRTLRKQVISRLLEENIVAQYAKQHRIRLSKRDLRKVDGEFKSVTSTSSGGRKLGAATNTTSAFMHQLLRNQLLVTRVESAVVPKSLLAGPSFKLRKFTFDAGDAGHKRALDLATGGDAGTQTHAPPVHWVASHRLDAQVRRDAALASNGDFIGPFSLAGKNVVYEVLARGRHTYGKPAREQVQADYFRRWMSKKVAEAESKCEKQHSVELACSLAHH